MSSEFVAAAEVQSSRGSIVRRPRATDAIGGALRSIYGQSETLPSEMELLLRQIDQRGLSARAC